MNLQDLVIHRLLSKAQLCLNISSQPPAHRSKKVKAKGKKKKKRETDVAFGCTFYLKRSCNNENTMGENVPCVSNNIIEHTLNKYKHFA